MKIRERNGTVRDMTQTEIDTRTAEHRAMLDKAKTMNDAQAVRKARIEAAISDKSRSPSAADFRALQQAVADLAETVGVLESK